MIRRFLEMKVDIMAVGWAITISLCTASITLSFFEFNSREGTIACDGAKSIMVNGAIYCKKAEEDNEE